MESKNKLLSERMGPGGSEKTLVHVQGPRIRGTATKKPYALVLILGDRDQALI